MFYFPKKIKILKKGKKYLTIGQDIVIISKSPKAV